MAVSLVVMNKTGKRPRGFASTIWRLCYATMNVIGTIIVFMCSGV